MHLLWEQNHFTKLLALPTNSCLFLPQHHHSAIIQLDQHGTKGLQGESGLIRSKKQTRLFFLIFKNLFKAQLILEHKTAIWEWETSNLETDKEEGKGEWGGTAKTSVLLKKIHWVINSPVASWFPQAICRICPTWGLHEHKKAETVPWTEEQERQRILM